MYKAYDCNVDKWGSREPNIKATLSVPSFTVSINQNKFVAIGYDTYAFLNGNLNGQQFSIGCLSQCQNISNVVNGSCSGIGCCQLDIPQGLKNVYLETYNFKNHTKDWDFNPCSFAFIIREDKFNFSSYYLISLRNNETLPMVIVDKGKNQLKQCSGTYEQQQK